jgi:hypothetical protein
MEQQVLKDKDARLSEDNVLAIKTHQGILDHAVVMPGHNKRDKHLFDWLFENHKVGVEGVANVTGYGKVWKYVEFKYNLILYMRDADTIPVLKVRIVC